MWYDKYVENAGSPQIINDSKTPSGRVHIGSLRGVLIHDAVYRAMLASGIEAKFLYGIDDFDPLDGLPTDAAAELQQYMGMPLCDVPAPAGSDASDMAEHYIQEFLGIFPELGVKAEIYRMRDIYRSGKFNESIDAILSKADAVRQIYADISKSIRPANWHPFQVICEVCGRVGTTEVSQYNGKEVVYACRPNLVTWATGCGYQGSVSPFDGHGKLPWKLEWAAKWRLFGVTVEGAGKDHCTKGGSRDVSSRVLTAILGGSAPVNIPYEFFLVRGAKMSSSKGIGTSAREIANFLPPEILRFLMIRTQPKRTVNFTTELDYIVKLFNEHDRILEKWLVGKLAPEDEKLLQIIEVDATATYYRPVSFQLITALLQLPHIDVATEILSRMETDYSDVERNILQRRIKAATYWLDNFAATGEKITLQEKIPHSANKLLAAQRMFLRQIAHRLDSVSNNENDLQQLIFNRARMIPLNQKAAFLALYIVLLDRESGPKGGSLLSYLANTFLRKRFTELPISLAKFWDETKVSEADCSAWLQGNKDKIVEIKADRLVNIVRSVDPAHTQSASGVIEIEVLLADGKSHLQRVHCFSIEASTIDAATELGKLDACGKNWVNKIEHALQVSVLPGQSSVTYEDLNDLSVIGQAN